MDKEEREGKNFPSKGMYICVEVIINKFATSDL